jgi:hypothetical protein
MQDAAALAEIPKFEGAPTIFSRFGAAVNPILIIGTLCLTLLNWDVEE